MKKQEARSTLRIVVERFFGVEDEEDGIYTKRPWIAKEHGFLYSPINGEPLPPLAPKSILRIVTEFWFGMWTIFAMGGLLFLIGYLFYYTAYYR